MLGTIRLLPLLCILNLSITIRLPPRKIAIVILVKTKATFKEPIAVRGLAATSIQPKTSIQKQIFWKYNKIRATELILWAAIEKQRIINQQIPHKGIMDCSRRTSNWCVRILP